MTFVSYLSKDYAEGQLQSAITTGAVSAQLKSGHGARFPAITAGQYFVGTLEKRTGTTVTSKERVLVSALSTDTVTFTRSFGGDIALAFDADDYFCLHINSAIITDMQAEITNLGSIKLNSAGGLRTALTNWRIYYSNGSGAETALAFGASGTYLMSNGASAAPTFSAPPLDINSQTTATDLDIDADYIAYYDASASGNKKGLAKYLKPKIGDGSDGAIGAGALTITGSNNTYIIKQYTTFAPGANTVTITPTNCILHIKVQGNCDLTGTTFSFGGKGGVAGAAASGGGGATINGGNGGDGNGTMSVIDGGAGGGLSQTKAPLLAVSRHSGMLQAGCGSGGGGGQYDSDLTGSAASGGAGGGCLILEVGGNLTFSGTTMNFNGANGGNTGGGSQGGGGGGAGGTIYILYRGTLSGSPTTNVTGGSAGTGGGTYLGGCGGNSITTQGSANSGTNGGAGAAGLYYILQIP